MHFFHTELHTYIHITYRHKHTNKQVACIIIESSSKNTERTANRYLNGANNIWRWGIEVNAMWTKPKREREKKNNQKQQWLRRRLKNKTKNIQSAMGRKRGTTVYEISHSRLCHRFRISFHPNTFDPPLNTFPVRGYMYTYKRTYTVEPR